MLKFQEKEIKREGSSNGLTVKSITCHSTNSGSTVQSGSTLPSQQYNANSMRKGEWVSEWVSDKLNLLNTSDACNGLIYLTNHSSIMN